MQFECFTEDYVTRLIERDPETEQHFIHYFSELLLLKLRRVLRTGQAIEDLRQETFVRVFRVLRAQGLRNPERIGAFVNTVCNHVISEYWRTSSRFVPLPDPIIDHLPESRTSGGGTVDAEDGLVNQARTQAIRQVLKELTPRDREILRMVFLEEKNKDDVCKTWSVDRNYLRVLVHRAKDRFRRKVPKISMVAAACSLDRAARGA